MNRSPLDGASLSFVALVYALAYFLTITLLSFIIQSIAKMFGSDTNFWKIFIILFILTVVASLVNYKFIFPKFE